MPRFKVLWTETVYKSCVIEAEDESEVRDKFFLQEEMEGIENEDSETNDIDNIYEVKP